MKQYEIITVCKTCRTLKGGHFVNSLFRTKPIYRTVDSCPDCRVATVKTEGEEK